MKLRQTITLALVLHTVLFTAAVATALYLTACQAPLEPPTIQYSAAAGV